jgi:hypothetical protein
LGRPKVTRIQSHEEKAIADRPVHLVFARASRVVERVFRVSLAWAERSSGVISEELRLEINECLARVRMWSHGFGPQAR